MINFEDWIHKRDIDHNWITVSQQREFLYENFVKDLFTTSVIVNRTDALKITENYSWLSDISFGNQSIWSDDDEIRYDPNSILTKNELMVEPFTIFRSWSYGSLISEFELIQDFILFYNLYWDDQENVYKVFDAYGEEFIVVKIKNLDKDKKMEINTTFLRNYLSIKEKVLVRQHDHRTRTKIELATILGSQTEQISFKTENYNFCLAFGEHHSPSEYRAFSRLLGKDIVLAFEQAKDLLGWKYEYATFVIGIDTQGNKIESTCNEEELSNYFVNKSTPHFLTPVFFKREVLKKYYDNPSKYSVKATLLSCSGLWSIPIDTNNESLVQVWLGDLGHIPIKEQKHWQLHNVVPEGGITNSRFERDFEARFTDPGDPMFKFNKSLTTFQEKFSKKYGFNSFLPLSEHDKFVELTLRIPVNNEIPEFEQQIGYLAKLLPDSIDISSLTKKLIELDSDKELEKINGKKIRTFELFLQKEGLDLSIIGILDSIQNIRSTAISHRKGKNFEKVFDEFDLAKTTKIEFFTNCINKCSQSLNLLSSQL